MMVGVGRWKGIGLVLLGLGRRVVLVVVCLTATTTTTARARWLDWFGLGWPCMSEVKWPGMEAQQVQAMVSCDDVRYGRA